MDEKQSSDAENARTGGMPTNVLPKLPPTGELLRELYSSGAKPTESRLSSIVLRVAFVLLGVGSTWAWLHKQYPYPLGSDQTGPMWLLLFGMLASLLFLSICLIQAIQEGWSWLRDYSKAFDGPDLERPLFEKLRRCSLHELERRRRAIASEEKLFKLRISSAGLLGVLNLGSAFPSLKDMELVGFNLASFGGMFLFVATADGILSLRRLIRVHPLDRLLEEATIELQSRVGK